MDGRYLKLVQNMQWIDLPRTAHVGNIKILCSTLIAKRFYIFISRVSLQLFADRLGSSRQHLPAVKTLCAGLGVLRGPPRCPQPGAVWGVNLSFVTPTSKSGNILFLSSYLIFLRF